PEVLAELGQHTQWIAAHRLGSVGDSFEGVFADGVERHRTNAATLDDPELACPRDEVYVVPGVQRCPRQGEQRVEVSGKWRGYERDSHLSVRNCGAGNPARRRLRPGLAAVLAAAAPLARVLPPKSNSPDVPHGSALRRAHDTTGGSRNRSVLARLRSSPPGTPRLE